MQVGHLQLWVGDHFQIDTASVVVDGGLHSRQVGEISQAGFYSEAHQRSCDECQGVAKQVTGGDDVLALHAYGQQGSADGGHAGIEGCNMLRPCQCFHPLLEMGDSGVGYPRIVRCFDPVAKDIRHLLCVLKLKGHICINRHGQ